MAISNPRIVSAQGSATGSGTARGVGRAIGADANTSSEIANMYRHVDTVRAMMEAKVDALGSKVDGQIATVMAEFRTAESKRSTDFDQVQRDFKEMKQSLPTKDDIKSSTRNWALLVGGFFVGLLTLLWMFFDTGAGVTGAVAGHIVDVKQSERAREAEVREIKALIQDLRKEQAGDDAQTGPRAGQAGPVRQGP